ncbi:MAG: hypothetical protein HC814_06290 [Rhodobacteraceae bacterium]|nr:hypothetical protein [Paracoccaceae bacterium]
MAVLQLSLRAGQAPGDARIAGATHEAALVFELNQNLPPIYSRYAPALLRAHPVENPQLRVAGDAPPT